MGKLAFIFPGQGSQQVGMGKDICREYPLARRILQQADRILGRGLSKLCFEGPKEQLDATVNTQPALLAVSYAFCRLLQAEGIEPQLVAGHSLGEYTALLAARALDYEDALKLVQKRARLMQEACPAGLGSMAAIVGLAREQVDEICRQAGKEEETVQAANFNCPGQIVVSGHKSAVARAIELAGDRGAKLARELDVSIPSHCSLMAPAAGKLADYLQGLDWRKPQVPLVSNIDAELVSTVEALKSALVKQLSCSVYWEDCIRRMLALGVDTFLEVGPGNVLSKLLKRTARGVRCYSVNNIENLQKAISHLINGG